jgi:hypothetical protein
MTTAELIYLRETRQNLSTHDMRQMADVIDDIAGLVGEALDHAIEAKNTIEQAQKAQERLADIIAQQGDTDLLADFKDLQKDLQDAHDTIVDGMKELEQNFDNTDNLF